MKELWKKIYGQARMWVNARELSLDPMPHYIRDREDFAMFTWWIETDYESYRVVVITDDKQQFIELDRINSPSKEIIIRLGA